MNPNPTLGRLTPKTTTPRLSLAMIVKNEEATIERVLACARSVCDELIVVDTGSTDRTVELAQQAGARVLPFAWIDDFAAARNHAFANCSGDWILWLDGDDVIADADQQKIRNLNLDDSLDAIFCNYQISFSPDGECSFSTLRERLIRRAAGLRWDYPVHECIAVPYGRSLERPDVAVQHRPRNLFYLANELKDHGKFGQAVPVYQEYLTVSDLTREKYWAYLSLIRCFQQLVENERARKTALEAVLLTAKPKPTSSSAYTVTTANNGFRPSPTSRSLPASSRRPRASPTMMPTAGSHPITSASATPTSASTRRPSKPPSTP
jgi:glycosyltransferase involved in cell wall biosynthesis